MYRRPVPRLTSRPAWPLNQPTASSLLIRSCPLTGLRARLLYSPAIRLSHLSAQPFLTGLHAIFLRPCRASVAAQRPSTFLSRNVLLPGFVSMYIHQCRVCA